MSFTFDRVGRVLLGVAGASLLAASFGQGRGTYAIGVLVSCVALFVPATRHVRAGYGEHLHLALLIARVLVDLLHWYSD